MTRVAYSEVATADLKKILSSLANQAGKVTVLKFRDRFHAVSRRLANVPQSGAPRSNLGENVRIMIVAPYVVIYRYSAPADAVEVLRIIHGKRDITARLL